MAKYLSGKNRVASSSQLSPDRYRYLSLEQAEPNLGDPLVGPSSVGAKPVPPGAQYIIVSTGTTSGERYWIPNQGGIIPGSISVFDEGVLVGTLSSITQFNFVGAAITASVAIASSNLATIRVFAPGNNQELLFNSSNEFSTSSKLTFNSSTGLLSAGDRLNVGSGGTVITTTGVGSVGIGTTNPTTKLHLQGDLRLAGTIYDYNNQPGTNAQILVKNNFGGLTWVNQGTIRAGAGGTYQNIQFHNNVGLVDGASNFVFDEVNSRVGIGSTQPKILLDVLGISSFKGGTTIDNLNVTGITTTSTLAVSGTSTTRNLVVTGVTTLGSVTGTNATFTGIVTASKFIGAIDVANLYVTGVSTFLQKVNIGSDLGVTGITTTQNIQVYQSTTLDRLKVTGISTFDSQVNINNLSVTGVGTFDNIKLDTNTISTLTGNLILDSALGTTQINDAVYINDTTESTSKDTGALIVEGGVGIEKRLNVGGAVNLATSGGITTTGGDLYVGGNLYLNQDIYQDEIFARNGFFTGILSTRNFVATGIATIGTLGVSGLTTTRNLKVIGISTFDDYIDANGGAYIDNIQIGITNDNTINTTTGNLTIDSAGGTTSINDQLIVSGITTISNTTDSTNKDTGALIVEGGVGIEKNLNVGGNVTLGDSSADTVAFNARVGSGITPSTNGTQDLGGSSNKWNTVYANTFNGAVTGNADTATKLQTARNIAITGDLAWNVNFDGSANVTGVGTLSNTGVVAGTYGSSTQVGILTVDAKGRITAASNVNIDFGRANYADNAGIATNIKGGATGSIPYQSSANNTTFLADPNANGRILTWNDTTNAPVWSDPTTISVGIASSLSVTTDGANANRFLVLSSTSSGITTALVDGGITYNPSTDLLSATNLTVSGVSTFNGNVTLGNATTDTVTYVSRVGSGITPSVNNTYDLGSSALRWNNLYVNNIVGNITGAASSLSVTTDGANATRYLVLSSGTSGITTALVDGGITYNPSTDLLSATNLTVSGTSEFDGNVILGDATTDTVTYVSRVGSGITPSVNNTYDLGSSTLRWNNLYVNTVVGNVTGAASSLSVTSDTSSTPRYLVLSSATSGITTALVDGGITYTPSTDLLTTPNLTVSGTSEFDGNVILGDATTDTVTYTARVGSGITPSTTNVYDLGSSTLRWNNLYVNTVVGNVTGAASSLNVTTDGANATRYLVLSSATSGITTALVDGGITYNPSTDLLSATNLTVTGTSLFNGNVTLGDVTTDTVTYTARVGSGITPSANNTYDLGSSTLRWNNLYVNNIVGNITGAASSLNVTSDTSSTPRYLVLSSATSGITTAFVDSGVTYTPSTDLLTVPSIKPTAIQDTSGGTGSSNFVLTANGSGGWSWQAAAAKGGITVQDEGSIIGTQLGITTVNFVGVGVTVTSPVTGTVNVSISSATSGITTLFVTQDNYGCSNPIRVTSSSGITTIGIGTTSNAYGRKYVQSTEPTVGVCDGDIWYDISGAGAIESLWSVGSGVDGDGNPDIYRFSQVGIGVTNPATRLHVKSPSAGSSTIVTIESTVNTAESAIRFLTNGSDWEIGSKGSAAALNPDDFYIYDVTRGEYKLTIGDGANGDLRFNSGYGSAATAYGVRVWANFNGSTAAARRSGNVSTITKLGTGYYRVNFSTSMPDTNYAAFVTHDEQLVYAQAVQYTTYNTGYIEFYTMEYSTGGIDATYINVCVVR